MEKEKSLSKRSSPKSVQLTKGGISKKDATISFADFLVALGVPQKVAADLAHSEVCIWIQGKNNKNGIAISDVKKYMDEGKLKPSMFVDKAMLKKIQEG